VRLAASSERTACLIQAGWEETVNPGWLAQCRDLVSLLVPDDHQYDPERDWQEETAFARAYGPQAVKGRGVLGGSVYAAVERGLDISSEHAARPVYQELLDSAELFSRPPGKGGRSKPVGLYPGHPELPGKEEEAEFERLLAAWLYLHHRYGGDTHDPTSSRAVATVTIARNICERHSLRLIALPKVEDEIRRITGAVTVVPAPKTLDDTRNVKRTAIALRNQGEFEKSLRLLDVALAALEDMSRQAGLDAGQAVDIRVERADTFGMKGGVYRRQKQLHEAYGQYKQGLEFEKVDQQSTYNLSNVIALGVTEEGISPRDPEMRQSIDAAISQLVRSTGGGRTDEWWAWSDLGQLHLLSGDPDSARVAYARARRTGPTAEEYERHLVMLKRLHEVTSRTAADAAAAIEKVLSELTSDAPPYSSAGV
jgi:tetratricopeptide (TPR) repeat protein